MESAKSVSYNNKGKGTIINLEQGKIPPQALDLEEAVLGAMMIDKKGVDDVIDIIHADAFTNQLTSLFIMLFLVFLKILNQSIY